MKTYLVIVSNLGQPTQKFIDVHNHSGGDPCLTDSISGLYFWPDEKEARRYMEMFADSQIAPNLSLHALIFSLSPALPKS